MTFGPITLSPRPSSPVLRPPDSQTGRLRGSQAKLQSLGCTLLPCPITLGAPSYLPTDRGTLPLSSTLHPPVKIDISLHLGVTFEPTVIIDHLGAYTFPPSPLISLSQATDFFVSPKQMVCVSLRPLVACILGSTLGRHRWRVLGLLLAHSI